MVKGVIKLYPFNLKKKSLEMDMSYFVTKPFIHAHKLLIPVIIRDEQRERKKKPEDIRRLLLKKI